MRSQTGEQLAQFGSLRLYENYLQARSLFYPIREIARWRITTDPSETGVDRWRQDVRVIVEGLDWVAEGKKTTRQGYGFLRDSVDLGGHARNAKRFYEILDRHLFRWGREPDRPVAAHEDSPDGAEPAIESAADAFDMAITTMSEAIDLFRQDTLTDEEYRAYTRAAFSELRDGPPFEDHADRQLARVRRLAALQELGAFSATVFATMKARLLS